MIVLMKEQMNTEEQQQFVDNFKIYLQYGYDNTKFIISFDDIWKWIGFARKDPAKRLLLNKFTKNIDFILLHQKVEQNKDTENLENIDFILLLFLAEQNKDTENLENRGGHNKETILLNVDTFKNFCLMASTENAKKIRNYYIKMENIMFQYTQEKLFENQKIILELETNYEKTQNKLNTFIEYDEELFWNENQIDDYNNKNVIYVAFIGIFDNERIYKYGKSEQIYTREFKQHQKLKKSIFYF
jgi:phage anti-repressor protein